MRALWPTLSRSCGLSLHRSVNISLDSGESSSSRMDGRSKIATLQIAHEGAGGGVVAPLGRIEGVDPTIELLSQGSLCLDGARVLLLTSVYRSIVNKKLFSCEGYALCHFWVSHYITSRGLASGGRAWGR